MQNLRLTLRGTRPLLQHNIRLSDPLDPATQRLAALTSKRKKTIADHQAIADTEFAGGLYHDPDLGPYVKAESVERCFRDAAALQRLGRAVQRGVVVFGEGGSEVLPLLYRGPRSVEELLADQNFRHRAAVTVGTSRTMRTRPKFSEWSLEVHMLLDESQIEQEQLMTVAVQAGALIGLGDRRPRYGRFEVEA